MKTDKQKIEILEKTMKGFSTEKKIRFLKYLLVKLKNDNKEHSEPDVTVNDRSTRYE
jgi:hypothetical protein